MTTTLLDADGNPPTIRRGESFKFTFAVTDPSISPTAPKNLTGALEVSFMIGFDRTAIERDLILTLADSPTTVSHDDDGGNVTVQGSAEQSEALPYGTRWCELWITDATGQRRLVGEGACPVHDTMATVP